MIGILVGAGLGMLGWSFTEYALHRWVGHGGRGRNEFAREHVMHHSKGDYFAPLSKKAKATGVALAAMLLVILPWAGAPGAAFVVCFLGAYLGYEVLHRRLHTHAPHGPYSRWVRRHHFYHHFMNPKMNHGVSSPIWDLVFGTYARPEVVRVPPKLAMRWLREEHYAGDYRLMGRA